MANVAEQPAVEEPAPIPRPSHPLTVLVVDDDPLVIMNTILMLEDLGHSTVKARSEEEALQALLDDRTFDLVMMDHSMPKMTGTQLAERICEWIPHVVGIFPNDDAIVRLAGALLLEANDEWAVQRARYMTLGTLGQMSDDPLISLPAVAG